MIHICFLYSKFRLNAYLLDC